MKIVILVHNLTGGGAERVAALWATGFTKRGHKVFVLTETYDKKQMTYDIHNGVTIQPITIKNRILRVAARILNIYRNLFLVKLNKTLHQINPDVCIGVLGQYALDAYNCTKDLNCKIINTEHNAYDRPEFLKYRPDIIKMKYETNKIFDCVTVLTEADTKVPGVPLENMIVLPNPLAFEPVKNIPHKDNFILAAGRLDVWELKGFDLLIKAWSNIAKSYLDWKLVIAGTGSKKSYDYLQNLATNLGVEKQIEFIGFCNDIISLYRRSSIFVLSSRHEGFGMVLIEAMSQGCACIACDFNGRQKEIIQSENEGIVCENDNVEKLTEAMDNLLSNPKKRNEIGYNAIQRSKYYSLNNTMDRWENIFKQIGANL